LPPPSNNYRLIGVSQDLIKHNVEILDRRYSIPTYALRPIPPAGVQLQVGNFQALSIPVDVIPYFALPQNYNGNLLRSYGGHLKYTVRFRDSGRILNAPDVIISVSFIFLLHVSLCWIIIC